MKFRFGDAVQINNKESFYYEVKGTVIHYDGVDGTFTVALPFNRVEAFYSCDLKGVKDEIKSKSKTDEKSN